MIKLKSKEKLSFSLVNPKKNKSFNEGFGINEIAYISDLHIENSSNIKTICEQLVRTSKGINIFAGDITNNFNIYKRFLNTLHKTLEPLNTPFKVADEIYIFLLGNHEYMAFKNKTYEEIIIKYKNEINKYNKFYFLDNKSFLCIDTYNSKKDFSNLHYRAYYKVYTTSKLDDNSLQYKYIVFGGTGFAGLNKKFNADDGLYGSSINREKEIRLSDDFSKTLKELGNFSTINNKKVIVCSHNPYYDFIKRYELENYSNIYLISGHTHKNIKSIIGNNYIFSNNQIGYGGKINSFTFKSFLFDYRYNEFENKKDGIYPINYTQYRLFMSSNGFKNSEINREIGNLYLLKRDDKYLFLREKNKQLCLMYGGLPKRLKIKDINYYYENMIDNKKVQSQFSNKFSNYEKAISVFIKSIGGWGTIHGSIIDIDFLNHIFVNPYDKTITAYWAYDIIDKKVYKSIFGLLTDLRPDLLPSFEKVSNSLIKYNKNNKLIKMLTKKAKGFVKVTDTYIYRINNIVHKLKKTDKTNIISMWVDKDTNLIETTNNYNRA